MSFTTTLQNAVNSASITIVDDYEIDTVGELANNGLRLSCGRDIDFDVDNAEIEIDSDGCTTIVDRDGNELSIEFRVSRPMTAADL